MTRREKALLDPENREVNGDIETMYADGSWHSCCPHFIDCGEDNGDDATMISEGGWVMGCRGITCVQCWSKEA